MNKFVDCLDKAVERNKKEWLSFRLKTTQGILPIIYQGDERALSLIWGKVSPQFTNFRLLDMSKIHPDDKPEPVFETMTTDKSCGEWLNFMLLNLKKDSLSMEGLGIKQVTFSKYILPLDSCDIIIKRSCEDSLTGVVIEVFKEGECTGVFSHLTENVRSSLLDFLSFHEEFHAELPKTLLDALNE